MVDYLCISVKSKYFLLLIVNSVYIENWTKAHVSTSQSHADIVLTKDIRLFKHQKVLHI